MDMAVSVIGFRKMVIGDGSVVGRQQVAELEVMCKVFDYFTEIFIQIMMFIMYIAPIGVFALMADATGTFGYDVLVKILYLIGLYVVVLALVTYVMVGGTVAMEPNKGTILALLVQKLLRLLVC